MKDTDTNPPQNPYHFASWQQVQYLIQKIELLEQKIDSTIADTNSEQQRPNDLLSKTEGQKYIQEKYGLKCGSPNTLKAWCEEFPNVLKPQSKEGLKGVYYARSDFDELALRKQGLL